MLFKTIPNDTKILFYQQLALLLKTGLTFKEALQAISLEDLENRTLQYSIRTIIDELQQGSSYSHVLEKHSGLFNPAIIDFIHKNENTKKLAELFNNLTDELERKDALRGRIIASLYYPAAILIIAFIIFIILATFVIPVFEQMYSDLGSELPHVTSLTFTVIYFINKHSILLFAFIGICILAIFKSKKLSQNLFIRMPFAGKLVKTISLISFLRNLSLFLSLGVSEKESISFASRMVSNEVFAGQLNNIAGDTPEDSKLVSFLKSSNLFPKITHHLLQISKKMNTEKEMLAGLATYFEKKFDRQLNRTLVALDILLMLIIGWIIGGFVIAMYMPIFKLAG